MSAFENLDPVVQDMIQNEFKPSLNHLTEDPEHWELCWYESEVFLEVLKALSFSANAHEGQVRRSGLPYICHPIKVAQYVAELNMPAYVIMAALLHDVVEDCNEVSIQDIKDLFGNKVATLVEAVTKLPAKLNVSKVAAQSDNFQKLMLASQEEPSAIIIKLLDRLHNMQSISAMSAEAQKRIALETYHVYAPLSLRIGLFDLSQELFGLSKKVLFPWRNQILDKALNRVDDHQGGGIDNFVTRIADLLEGDLLAIPRTENEYRVTHMKSAYQLERFSKRHNVPLKGIKSLYEVQFILPSKTDCYKALGQIHEQHKVKFSSVKDYFANPKLNGYSALHTTIFTPNGLELKIILHTPDSYDFSDLGIATQYQPGNSSNNVDFSLWTNFIAGLNLNELITSDFYSQVKEEIGLDKIFVYSPKGDVFSLPVNSTALDFAFHIHTKLGLIATSCEVNGKLNSTDVILKNGDTVEIHKGPVSFGWEYKWKRVTTIKARNSIKRFLKKQEHAEELTRMGRVMLNDTLDMKIHMPDGCDESIEPSCFNGMTWVELYQSIALGERSPALTAYLLTRELTKHNDSTLLMWKGWEKDENLKLSGCCSPILGDNIMGIIEDSKTLHIHKATCSCITDNHKAIEVKWSYVEPLDLKFESKIKLEVINKVGALAQISQQISNYNLSIEDINTKTLCEDRSELIIKLHIPYDSAFCLDKVMAVLGTLPVVNRVSRYV